MAAIAVLDVGKTNVKVMLYDDDGDALAQRSRPNVPVAAPPYLHVDIDGIWRFTLDALASLEREHGIGAIVTTAHGAAATLVDDDALVLPMLDYEEAAVAEIEPEYATVRPPFGETFSPPMQNGLTVGRQLYFQMRRFPKDFARARHLLTYPQYWSWRLSGIAATELTSLACHTDLWEPVNGRFSSLARGQGWDRLLPPLRRPWDRLGSIKPEIARATGLDPATAIINGIHDSNAALLPHVIGGRSPLTVISSGTWVVAMAIGGSTDRLDPAADMLATVSALGGVVPNAKFMGGREYGLIAGEGRHDAAREDIAVVIASGALALPSFAEQGGAFPFRKGGILGALPERPAARVALADLYEALMTDDMLDRLGADAGPLVVEGSFGGNAALCGVLAALRPGQPVEAAETATGTARGAAMLARWPEGFAREPVRRVEPWEVPGLAGYRRRWRGVLGD